MTILLRNALIKDKFSKHFNKRRDILIENGNIVRIAASIDHTAEKVVDVKGLCVSPGWVDVFVSGNDPGFEFKDDLISTARSAAHGGFTHVFLTPNTQPVVQNKTSVEYIVGRDTGFPVCFHPIGAVTRNTDGKELTDMYEMKQSGAIAFGDGNKPVQSAGLLIKALQYVKAFNGTVVQLADDPSVSPSGLMNEGNVSTQIGLPGKPALSEEITIRRDIALSEYAESNLHITGISLASSVEIIRQAKKSNTRISCSVPLHNLMFTEEELLSGYNPLFKLSPPLRSATDRSALIEGIMDGTIDIVTTHHTAQHNDVKMCEFEYAAHGALGLEAAFGILNELKIDVDNILNCICYNPRKVFGLECILEEGAEADITLFTEDFSYEFTSAMNQSKSKNSPYLGRTLKGKIIGTILNKEMNKINLHV